MARTESNEETLTSAMLTRPAASPARSQICTVAIEERNEQWDRRTIICHKAFKYFLEDPAKKKYFLEEETGGPYGWRPRSPREQHRRERPRQKVWVEEAAAGDEVGFVARLQATCMNRSLGGHAYSPVCRHEDDRLFRGSYVGLAGTED